MATSKTYTCEVCGKTFEGVGAAGGMHLHFDRAHGPMESCPECGQEYQGKARLALHRRVHGIEGRAYSSVLKRRGRALSHEDAELLANIRLLVAGPVIAERDALAKRLEEIEWTLASLRRLL